VFTKRGELLRAQAQDAPQAVRGFETPAPIALLDDAASQARADAGQPGDFVGAGPVEVERPGSGTGAGGAALARVRGG
jgi:hypothetical protein